MGTLQVSGQNILSVTGSPATATLNENVNINDTLAGATFPAGHVIQTLVYTNTGNGQTNGTNYAKSDNSYSTSATSTPNWSLTKKSANSNILIEIAGSAWTGSHNNGQQEGYKCDLRHSLNSDMSSATEVGYFYLQYDTRGGDNPPSQTSFNANGIAYVETYTTSAIGTVIYFDIKKATYGSSMNAGYVGYNAVLVLKITEIQQ